MAPSDHTLLVTGATGYVAGHVIHQALTKGYNVRACVRSESAREKILATFPNYGPQLSFALVKGITRPEFFKDAFADGAVTGVIHLASPILLNPEDNRRDTLDPAINGAKSIIEAAKLFGPSVQRVVNTSSMAALLDVSKGLRPGHTYSEKDWNPMTYDEAAEADPISAYCASKALAEKSMWELMESGDAKPTFSFVSVNPSMIYGPEFYPITGLTGLKPSTAYAWAIVDAPEVPPSDYAGVVDVRDVAEALLLAFETPKAAGQRYLLAKHFDWQTAADAIREALGEPDRSRIPAGSPGSMDNGAWKSVTYGVDGSKAVRELGFEYRPLKDTMGDAIKQLLDVEKKIGKNQAS
ncbi:hypothetical protein TsFJ059_009204 [Trichoderma semiorbis]|uniref:NAD-dependent epimerase/dehydratase domain-containing protein n=1 Tax=Trichoderma semiorbis TaxID=1491008 RepID=A0A9P8KMB8_9HYPO|nr:hypothetical protein TsFJ059_009204 [Trichoderma semiorbis]